MFLSRPGHLSWTTGHHGRTVPSEKEDTVAGRVRVVPYEPGLDALERHVHATVVRPVTEAVADDMRRYVPILTSALHDSIHTEYPSESEGRVYFGNVDEGVDYHLYQEYGTSIMEAQPYARPALFKSRSL